MRSKHTYLSLLILFSMIMQAFNNQVSAQDVPGCYTSHVDPDDSLSQPPLTTRPPLSTTCSRNSEQFGVFEQPLSYLTAPDFNPNNPLAIEKKVKLRFVVIEANPLGPNKENFRPADMAKLGLFVDYLNEWSANLEPLNKPSPYCGLCDDIDDQQIRFELTDVEFVTSATNYHGIGNNLFLPFGKYTDTILNVYLIPTPNYYDLDTFPGGSYTGERIYRPGGWADAIGGIATVPYYVSHHHIAMMNTFLSAHSESTYRQPWHTFDYFLKGEALRLLHEFNHAMGLRHLIGVGSETCNFADPNYLWDVFLGGSITCPTNTLAGQDPYDPATNHTNNIMDYRQFANMTPLQVGRNHRSAYIGTFKDYVYPTQPANTRPYLITYDQTWDSPTRMYQDVIVKSGNTLTITCDVQMPYDGRILVEKGAKLIVDGGILRSYHKKARWRGIDMEGDRDASALQINQAYVELKNGAIIEQAESGIRNFTWDNGAEGGGIIKATNSHFYNCWRGIELNDYEKFVANVNINGCNFTIDDLSGAVFGTPFESQITSWAVKRGVKVQNCTFKIELDQDAYPQKQRRGGIQTSKTGMFIYNNTFDGFSRGIYATDYAGSADRPVSIYNNVFEKNTQSIFVAATAYSNIRGNQISKIFRFEPGGPAGYTDKAGTGVGVFLDNTWGSYVGCNNSIDGTPSDDGVIDPIIGVLAHNTSSMGATIIDNNIEHADVGVQTQEHGHNLNITCNNFEENDVALLVNPKSPQSAYFLKNQGTGCGPTNLRAGNMFNVLSNGRDIWTYLTNQWSYYAFFSIPRDEEVAYNTWGNLVNNTCGFGSAASDPNSQCGKWWNCAFQIPPEMIATERSNLRDLALNGLKYEAAGQALIGSLIQAYSDADDDAGLIDFLEAQGDDNAYRLLIPLYIENARYSDIDTPIIRMSISNTEKDAYRDYYAILIDLKQSGRRPGQLTGGEYSTIETLAGDDLEVSALAKALLEQGYGVEWDHKVEVEDPLPISFKSPKIALRSGKESRLYEAAPNPAGTQTTVRAYVDESDVDGQPQLVVRDLTGKLIASFTLQTGDVDTKIHTAELQPGMYFYSLVIHGKVKETRKLSVVH